jgi:hypothetical protein
LDIPLNILLLPSLCLLFCRIRLAALVAIPFLDRSEHEPESRAEAFNWRKRGWAFAAMGLFLRAFFI